MHPCFVIHQLWSEHSLLRSFERVFERLVTLGPLAVLGDFRGHVESILNCKHKTNALVSML